MSRRTWMTALAVIASAACAREWEAFDLVEAEVCAAPRTACEQACVDVATDPANCGGCDVRCNDTQVCSDGMCIRGCGLAETDDDPWGVRWETTNRLAAPYDEAEAMCASLGARLPTVTESVRAITAAVVPQVSSASLWTIVPASPTQQMVVPFEQATNAANAAVARSRATPELYRCVCGPLDEAQRFTTTECDREQAGSCVTVDNPLGGSVVVNADARDRTPLPLYAAVWECQFFGAHLLDWQGLDALRSSGVEADRLLWTSNLGTPFRLESLVLRLTSEEVLDRVETSTIGAKRSFRCVGIGNDAATVVPPADAWTAPSDTHLRGDGNAIEGTDSPPALWLDAVRACSDRGAHLPSSHELAELAMAGLRATGEATPLWTTDVQGNDNIIAVTFTVPAAANGFDWSNAIVYDDRDNVAAYRCITYPLVPDVAEPRCNGGCAATVLPGTNARLWLDSEDRLPTDLDGAMTECQAAGGQLASERDLIEMMRRAGVTGSGEWLQTSSVTDDSVRRVHVRWIDPAMFEADRGSDWTTDNDNDPQAFRCAWTNEVR